MSEGFHEFPRGETETLEEWRNTPVAAILQDYWERLNVVAVAAATIRDTVTQWKGDFNHQDRADKELVEAAILIRLGTVISRLEADVHAISEQLMKEDPDRANLFSDDDHAHGRRIRRG